MSTNKKTGKGRFSHKVFWVIGGIFIGIFFIGGHEVAVRYGQDLTCTICHEMVEPIEKWQASGTAKNHSNCAGCHYDSNISGWWHMNYSAAKFLVLHFLRPDNEPIQPLPEPLFLDETKEPGYWSRVPNHRCYQCHEAKNHREEDQQRVHGKVVENVLSKPCMDCHNHNMRNGQKFYEKVQQEQSINS